MQDSGIAANSRLLGATEAGLGGCMIASLNRGGLRAVLEIEAHLEILLVPAIGVHKETVVIEELLLGGSHRYWGDEAQVHHVPKRPLDEIVLSE